MPQNNLLNSQIKSSKTSYKIKAVIFFCSLLFFTLILEILLQAVSLVANNYGDMVIDPENLNHDMKLIDRLQGADFKDDFSGKKTIMCIGDSYTVGGFGKPENSYPTLLQKELNRFFPEKFQVINGAYCESNSSSTLIALKDFYKIFKIDILIILSGSTNKFNFENTDFNKLKYGLNFLKKIKIYKIARIIYLNLKARKLADNSDKFLNMNFVLNPEETVSQKKLNETGEKLYNSLTDFKDINIVELGKQINSKSDNLAPEKAVRALWFYSHFNKPYMARKVIFYLEKKGFNSLDFELGKAFFHFKKNNLRFAANYLDLVLKKYPTKKSRAICFHLFNEFADSAAQKFKFDEAVLLYSKAIVLSPLDFYCYYRIMKIFNLQSTVSAEQINILLSNIEKNNPEINSSSLFNNYKSYFKNKNLFEDKIRSGLVSDLRKMINIAKTNESDIIIMTYPHPYRMANDILKRCALNNNNIQFLDLEKIFKKHLQKNDRKIYFIDDDHCTDQGHYIMAKSIIDKFKDFFEKKSDQNIQ